MYAEYACRMCQEYQNSNTAIATMSNCIAMYSPVVIVFAS